MYMLNLFLDDIKKSTLYQYIKGIFEIVEQVIRYNLVWVSLRLINCEAVYEKRKLTQTKPNQQFQIFLII